MISLKKTIFKYNHFDVKFKTDKGLRIHVGKLNKSVLLQTPEKERNDSDFEEPRLALTPNKVASQEEELEETALITIYCELKNQVVVWSSRY